MQHLLAAIAITLSEHPGIVDRMVIDFGPETLNVALRRGSKYSAFMLIPGKDAAADVPYRVRHALIALCRDAGLPEPS